MSLMTSVMRSASPGLAFQVAATTYAISAVLPGGGADGVTQDADGTGLHLDDITGAEPTVQLQPGAAGGGARAQHVAGTQGLVLGRVGDEVTEAVVHVGGGVAAPAFAVDAHLQLEGGQVDLVGGDDAGPQDVGPVPLLRLGRAHADRQLAALDVAGGHVVPDGEAEHIFQGLGRADVAAGPADDGGQLELVVELAGVGRPGQLDVRADDGVADTAIQSGHLVPLGGDLAAEVPEGVLQVPLEGQEVPQRARPDGGEQPGVRDGPLRAGWRAGLDERGHVALEADVDHGGAVEPPDPRPAAGLVGHILHEPTSCTASMIFT